MKRTLHTGVVRSVLIALLFWLLCPVQGQEIDSVPGSDSLHAVNVQKEARELELSGDAFVEDGDPERALPSYLRVLSIFEFEGDTTGLRDICMKIGDAYTSAGAHEKAGEYYRRSMDLLDEEDLSEKTELSRKMGGAALLSGKPQEARGHFLLYEQLLAERGENPMPAHRMLLRTYRTEGDFDACLSYAQQLLGHYRSQEKDSVVALLHNNMGHYLTQLGRFREAVEQYTLAVDYAERAGFADESIAVMEANQGVCYQNMNEPDLAKENFNKALGSLRGEGLPAERSRIENMQALLFFHEDDLYNAGFYSQEAISSAERANDSERLADAYHTYSRVLRAGNDPVHALQYYESYLAIRDSLQFEQKLNEQQQEDRIARLEQSEDDLLLRLKEEKVNELAIDRLTMQLEQEEQARQLLQQENELQQLEQQQRIDKLALEREQQKQREAEQEIVLLEQQQQIDKMALEREQRENRATEQENTLLKQQQEQRENRATEQENTLLKQQQELDRLSREKDKARRKLLMGLVLFMIIVVILVTWSLVATRKRNLLLARQKREISAQRDEIEAQRDEIETQRDLVFNQKEAIEQYSVEITKSIEYAKRIQTSTLPDLELLRKAVADYFVLFRPRDIVSGDFYWMAHVEDTTVLVVADCTGHGVPGAFMSMLGISLLKEIVQKEYVTHPGVIMQRIRKEIMRLLGQKGIQGEQRDGMDMSLIEINRKEKQIRYAGAYNPLYLVRSSRITAPDIPEVKVHSSSGHILYEIPADRMPVAIFDRMDKFTTHGFPIEEGDQLYLFTDGYPDQFGGEHGKKLKYKPFKELILRNASQPMDEQNREMASTLDGWQGAYDQVDDICVIGVRF